MIKEKSKKLALDVIYNEDGISGIDRIPDKCIDLLLTDPPYGISQQLNCKGQKLGRTAKLDFDFGSWDKNMDISWADKALSKVKGWAIIFCAKQDISRYWKIFEINNFKAIDVLVWQKPDPLPLNAKSKMLNAWESAIIGKREGAFFGGYCTHNIFKFQAPKGRNRVHPTQKPLELIKRLIELTTQKNDIILDMFIGSGTTAIAAKQMGRRYIGFETDKQYYKIANDIVNTQMKEISLFSK